MNGLLCSPMSRMLQFGRVTQGQRLTAWDSRIRLLGDFGGRTLITILLCLAASIRGLIRGPFDLGGEAKPQPVANGLQKIPRCRSTATKRPRKGRFWDACGLRHCVPSESRIINDRLQHFAKVCPLCNHQRLAFLGCHHLLAKTSPRGCSDTWRTYAIPNRPTTSPRSPSISMVAGPSK